MFSRAQRAGLLAIAAQVTALLEQDDGDRAAAEFRAQPPVASPDPAVCEHPADRRTPAAAMGHPNATVCTACGTTVEG